MSNFPFTSQRPKQCWFLFYFLLSLSLSILSSSRCCCLAFAPLSFPSSTTTTTQSAKTVFKAAKRQQFHSSFLHMTTTKKAELTTTTKQQNENKEAAEEADFSSMPSIYKPNPPTTLYSYKHKEKTLTYRYKPASPGHENDDPLLLIHPVGIGLSSWFWDKFLDEWDDGCEVYAPDLIGCGLENGIADKWILPKKEEEEDASLLPQYWVEACETLMEEVILPSRKRNKMKNSNKKGGANFLEVMKKTFMDGNANNNNAPSPADYENGIIAVAQGGLAPIGISLASRNSANPTTNSTLKIKGLVLTSPPKWNEMITPIPPKNLKDQYDFFTSNIRGGLAFSVLESKWAVKFFSNLFLFSKDENGAGCDEEWIERATGEAASKEARTPVMVFNAGFCNAKSYENELQSLNVKTLVLSGIDDLRTKYRKEYGSEMRYCTLQSIKGMNVLPWESPREVCGAVQTFMEGL